MLSVIYYGGLQMSESLLSVGELSSFLMYAAYVGISISGTLWTNIDLGSKIRSSRPSNMYLNVLVMGPVLL